MATIGDVLRQLNDQQRKRLADKRGVTVRGLARSYHDDWVELVRDLTNAELRHALGSLPDSELRIVALRAFDGRRTGLEDIRWNEDGTAQRRRQAKGIVKALCNWSPDHLQANTWDNVIVKMLRDVGMESTETPAGNDDLVRLRRIFP